MKRILQLALLFLLPVTALAQYPPVGVYGPVGSKGSGFPTIFPVTITIPTDADYPMAYPDMSGSSGLLQVNCAVSLSTQRNVIAQTISGFWWFVENNCNQPVYVKESTGAGVQILSGYAQIVGCDLTHCFTPPQGSGGTVLSVAGTPPVSCTGGANVTCLMAQANSTTDGYLSHIDWVAFYGKQNALGYTPAHSGANSDITSLSGLTTPLSSTQGGSGTAGGTGYRYGNGASPDSYSPTIPCSSITGGGDCLGVGTLAAYSVTLTATTTGGTATAGCYTGIYCSSIAGVVVVSASPDFSVQGGLVITPSTPYPPYTFCRANFVPQVALPSGTHWTFSIVGPPPGSLNYFASNFVTTASTVYIEYTCQLNGPVYVP